MSFKIRKGETATGLASVLVVDREGRCTAKRDVRAVLISSSGWLQVPQGTVISVYYFIGEGCAIAGSRGHVIQPCDFWTNFNCRPEPVITLWLQVRNAQGLVGWTREREKFRGTSNYD